MAFPSDPLGVTIEAAFGADRSADPSTWSWTDLTDRWHLDDDLTVFTGRREGARQAEAGSITLTFRNTDGELTPEDPRSQWWPHVDEGLPIRVTLDPQLAGGETLVFGGFVAKIVPRWPSGSGRFALVEVVAGGVIRQHARGSAPLRSALYRATPLEPAVVASWPLAGLGQDATEVPSPVAGVAPMVVRPTVGGAERDFAVRWSGDLTGPGLGALPTVTFADAGFGLTGQVPTGVADRYGWGIWGRVEGNDVGTETTMWIDTNSTVWLLWLLWENHSNSRVLITARATDPQGNFIALLSNTNEIPFDDRWHQFAAIVEQDGADTNLTILMDGEEVPMTLDSGSLAGLDIGAPQQARATASLLDGNGGMSIGYPTVLTGASVAAITTAIQGLYTAGRGHTGEPAVVRAQRICDEEGVPITVIGTATDSEPMGPQHPGTLVEILRECERTDDGILSENEFGFWVRTRGSRYNQDPALVIDAVARELGRQFEPVRDDQRARNEWTVTNRDGGEVTVLDAVDQQRRGRKADTLTVNVAAPQRVAYRASWELSRSTLRVLRYPTLTVHLHSSPALLAQVMATRLGDRVQVTHPPAQHPPGPVDQVVEGIRHTIRGRRAWTWEAVVAPYAPWQVGVYADDAETPGPAEPKRYGPYDSQVETAFTVGTDTALSVEDQTGGNDLWSQAADLPFDIRVRGVRLRVTAVGAPTGAVQTLTVDQTPINGPGLDGIVITAGEPVELWAPARYAL